MRILVISSNVTGWMCRGMLWLLDRHWPGHPPVIVGGYDRPELPAGVDFYKIGEWADYPVNRWSDGLIRFVEAQPDENFILTFDDFWLIDDVPHDLVMALWRYFLVSAPLARLDLTDDRAKSGGAVPAGTLRYRANDGSPQLAQLVTTPPETPYQLSFQTGIWNKRALLRHMVPGETPAQAEIHGAARMSRSRAGVGVAGTVEAPFKYLIVMQHGSVHIDDPGYQAAGTALLAGDRAELDRLGYLAP